MPMVLFNRHYAGRSLQIYRALDFKFKSFSTLVNLNHRLQDTVADTSEEIQGFVTEILLTLKMNARLFTDAYLEVLASGKTCTNDVTQKDKQNKKDAIKQKSKSLQMQKQMKQQIKQDVNFKFLNIKCNRCFFVYNVKILKIGYSKCYSEKTKVKLKKIANYV